MEGTKKKRVNMDEVMETARREAERSYEYLDMGVYRKVDRGF
jgi:hypothetical protein